MKKKILLRVLALCMALSSFTGNINVKAFETPNLNISNIDQYVTGGSGTEESPYILDDNCPYKPLLDAIAFKEYLGSMINSSLQINTLATEGTFNGKTKISYKDNKGITHAALTSGGYWLYKSNKPNVTSDGNCWVQTVVWIDAATVRNTPQIYNNYSYLSALANLAGSATSIAGLITAFTASATVGTVVGIAGGAIAIATLPSTIRTIRNTGKYIVYSNAGKINKGVMKIVYSSSYHGSWYQSRTECVWTNYPYAYYPASCFGNGIFTPDWKTAKFVI